MVRCRIRRVSDPCGVPVIHRGDISTFIADSITAQVEEEIEIWGSKPGVTKLVRALEDMAQANDVLLKGAQIQLENS